MKKQVIAALLTGAFVLGTLPMCAFADDLETITVAATANPHAEILEEAKPLLEELGYDLEIEVFADYVLPNNVVESGEMDANYFQHINYLNSFNEEQGTHLVDAGEIHYEPFGIYAGQKESLDDVEDGDTIGVPNDTTNEARALLLLEAQGLITLDPEAGITATPEDITDNPYNLDIEPFEAAQVARHIDEVSFVVLNGNYALEAGLNAGTDALAVEALSTARLPRLRPKQSKLCKAGDLPPEASALKDWLRATNMVCRKAKHRRVLRLHIATEEGEAESFSLLFCLRSQDLSANLLFSMIQRARDFHSDHLEDLEQDDQDCDGNQHDVSLPAVISILDRDVAKSASGNGTRHGGVSEDRAERDGRAGNQRCLCLYQKDTEHDRRVARSHGACRLNHAAVDLLQGGLHHTRDIGRCRHHQRNDGGRGSVALSHQEPGKRDEQDQEDQERNASHDVDDHIHDTVDQRVRVDSFLVRHGQEDSDRKSDQVSERRGHQRHIYGLDQTVQEQHYCLAVHQFVTSSTSSPLSFR